MNEGLYISNSPDLGWHVISGEMLLDTLQRVEKGESAALVYAEMWANASHEQIEGDEHERPD